MLTKTAEEMLEDHSHDPVIAGGLALGATIPFDSLSKSLGRGALDDMPRASIFLPFKLRNKLDRNVKIVRTSNTNGYHPLKDVVYHDGSVALAHELGHSQSPLRSVIGKNGLAGITLTNYLDKRFRLLPIAVAVHISSDEGDRTASGVSTGVLGTAKALQLAEEASASLRGIKLLRGEVTPEEYRQAAKAFSKAFGSYAVPALGSTAAAALIGSRLKAARNNLRSKNEDAEESPRD